MALLLLDLDNTVADRHAAFEHWAQSKLAVWASGDEQAHRFLVEQDDDGRRPRVAFLQSVRSYFALTEPAEVMLREYRAITLEGFPPVDRRIEHKLRSLRRDGWSIAVVTNGEDGVQRATVDRIGLSPLIDDCVVSEAVGFRKPHPRIFKTAMDRLGAPPGPAWMIGDSEVDVIGAARAGIRSVWLARGREWAASETRPDRIAESLLDALELASCTELRES